MWKILLRKRKSFDFCLFDYLFYHNFKKFNDLFSIKCNKMYTSFESLDVITITRSKFSFYQILFSMLYFVVCVIFINVVCVFCTTVLLFVLFSLRVLSFVVCYTVLRCFQYCLLLSM